MNEPNNLFTKVRCPWCNFQAEYYVIDDQKRILYKCPHCELEFRISSKIEIKKHITTEKK